MADPNDHASATRAPSAPKQASGRPETGAEARAFDGDLGVGTPANVDIHKLGQGDRPQEYWGEPADPDATFSSNHSRRGEPTQAERVQGGKTRRANKDIVSRRN
jgi:hypothetical protein